MSAEADSQETDDGLDLMGIVRDLYQRYGRGPTYVTLWMLVASGRIPAYRVGRNWRVSRVHVPWIAAHFGLEDYPAPDARQAGSGVGTVNLRRDRLLASGKAATGSA
jgi:hypothetical protein